MNILNGNLCWHDGVGISYESDQKHAEAIIRETGSIQSDIFESPHGNANNSRLGEGGEIGEVFEEQTQGSVVVQISRNAVPT